LPGGIPARLLADDEVNDDPEAREPPRGVRLTAIAREWGRIGCIGFGGPPTHISLLRELCVRDQRWMTPEEFEDGVAACNLLPGPASTQLAIFCAWRLRGPVGALVGGACFIVPGLVVILALSALFLAKHRSRWVSGIATGAGAAVPAVAVYAASRLVPPSWRRAGTSRSAAVRWCAYAVAGAVAAATIGPWLVLVLVSCGLVEVTTRVVRRPSDGHLAAAVFAYVPAVMMGGLLALAWVAFKVGALSYGGGFVIVPLMQRDAVHTYHWMTAGQFLTAVALGQITPGPVVQTVAVVGYAASGVLGGLLAALVAFFPSFAFVLGGAPHFERLRKSMRAQFFLTGAGAGAIGAIAGSAIPLALAIGHLWELGVLGVAAIWLLVLRRSVVLALVGAGVIGLIAAASGAPVA
jgi:chromate transporter